MFTRFVSVAVLLMAAPAFAQTAGTPALHQTAPVSSPASPSGQAGGASTAVQPLANGSPSAMPNATPGAGRTGSSATTTTKPSAAMPGSATANTTAPVGNAASSQINNH